MRSDQVINELLNPDTYLVVKDYEVVKSYSIDRKGEELFNINHEVFFYLLKSNKIRKISSHKALKEDVFLLNKNNL